MSSSSTKASDRKKRRGAERARSTRTAWVWGCAVALVVLGVVAMRVWRWRQPPVADDVATATSGAEGQTPASGSKPSTTGEASLPKLNEAAPPGPAPEGMAWVPGGWFWMGQGGYPDALPEHLVFVDGFWADTREVTVAEFARFVEATGYKTIAERPLDPAEFPTVPPEDLKPGSIVFSPPDGPVPLDNHLQWWTYVPGASWRHPEGPDSTIDGREDHPVVQIAWPDAVAYAQWAGKRLPTEAEWELAARGGLDRAEYCWGNELRDGADWKSNIWQGNFPNENSEADHFRGTAPVGSFPPNGYGLYDMSGNVWEWCSDWYRPDYYQHSAEKNPAGPNSSFDPQEPGMPKRVQRGGSFMCADSYCRRYVPGARGKGEPSSAAGHIGFRCVKSPK
jgi:formylglycine-generating enzyme required for sulfatase activity